MNTDQKKCEKCGDMSRRRCHLVVIIIVVANAATWPNIPMQKSELWIFTQEVLLENFSFEISNSDGGILWFSSRPPGKLQDTTPNKMKTASFLMFHSSLFINTV